MVPINLFAPNKYISVYNWLKCDHIDEIKFLGGCFMIVLYTRIKLHL